MVKAQRFADRLSLFVAGCIGLSGLIGCSRAVPDAEAQTRGEHEVALAVRVAPVRAGPVDRPIRATGLVVPKQSLDLAFKLGGVLANVEVDDGAQVKKGQVLARLDPTEISASVSQARESLAKAERDAARVSKLHDERVVPQSDFDNAKTGVSVAKSATVAADFNLRHTLLVAPSDGWIDARSGEPGEIVAPGRPVLRFSSKSKGWIAKVALADRDALSLSVGDRAEITLDAAVEHKRTGTVATIATAADPRTGTFAVEVLLEAKPGEPELRAGLTAKVLFPRAADAAFVVPVAALSGGERDRAFVYAVKGDHAQRVAVRVAFLTGESAALSAGLEGYDRVIVSGGSDLRDGGSIVVVESTETAK